jgi:predicted nucleotidyltransferase
MRLKELEISALLSVLEPNLTGMHAKLFLHGSRVSDNLRGGDIDLLLLFRDKEGLESLERKKASLLSRFQKQLGERRIDLTFSLEGGPYSPFVECALKNAILLKEWSCTGTRT